MRLLFVVYCVDCGRRFKGDRLPVCQTPTDGFERLKAYPTFRADRANLVLRLTLIFFICQPLFTGALFFVFILIVL